MLLAAEPLPWILLVVGALLGWLLLTLLRRRDHATWVAARAPQLPIRALAVGDDAWITGVVRCSRPLSCPWFGGAVVAFSYRRERKHTRTVRDKDGKTRTETEWRTEESLADATDFDLDDGARIVIRADGADNEAWRSLPVDYEGSSLRHSASIVEVGATLSVLGVKQDDGSITGEREVPCRWSRKPPEQVVAAGHRGEAWLFALAWLLPALAAAGATVVFWQGWYWEPAFLGSLFGAFWLGASPFWAIGTYNRLIRLRQQVQAAFAQVDVDLALRAALVPNLVAVVQQASAHEQGLLRDLAGIRAGRDPAAATAAEGPAAAACRQVLLLHERYPELRSDALYRDLHDRLWACEEKIAHSRGLYNDVVQEWNDRQQHFPAVLVARLAGCKAAPFFAVDDERVPPPLAIAAQ